MPVVLCRDVAPRRYDNIIEIACELNIRAKPAVDFCTLPQRTNVCSSERTVIPGTTTCHQ
jgi:hypothetical protein